MRAPVSLKHQLDRRYKPRENSIHSYDELAETLDRLSVLDPPEKLIAEARWWAEHRPGNEEALATVAMLERHFYTDTKVGRVAARYALGRYYRYSYAIAYPCSVHELTDVQRSSDCCHCKERDIARALANVALTHGVEARPDIDWLQELAAVHRQAQEVD